MTNPDAVDPEKIVANLGRLHAEFLSTKRFMTADVIAQAIALIQSRSPRTARSHAASEETLRLKRASSAKKVTGEELLAALEEGESDPAYKAFLRETLDRISRPEDAGG